MTTLRDAVRAFENYCTANDLRVTPPRLAVFKIVFKAKKPITAYDVLEEMGKVLKNPQPPTAYRALDFLAGHGFIHRIESLNAYVSCDVNHRHNGSQFLVCDSCGEVEEIHLCSLPETLREKVTAERFKLHHWNLEVHGACGKCVP